MKRTLIALVLASTALTACGGDGDVSPDQLKQALVAQGIEDDFADCIVADLEANLSTEDFNTLALADEDLNGVSTELQTALTDTVTACFTETGG